MSQTSAVNSTLRQQIINILKPGKTTNTTAKQVSNAFIEQSLQFTVSLRKIQEATQKMVLDGTLVATKRGFYSLSPSWLAYRRAALMDQALR